jgi:hypothetical protein
MEKEFIPYEQALALKELGFDEPCIRYYWTDGMFSKTYNEPFNYSKKENTISAPLYQQVFRWFREKYKLVAYIKYYAEWNFEIFRIDDKIAEVQDDVNVDYTFRGGSYEEAELECLKKLIEIIKNKQ